MACCTFSIAVPPVFFLSFFLSALLPSKYAPEVSVMVASWSFGASLFRVRLRRGYADGMSCRDSEREGGSVAKPSIL